MLTEQPLRSDTLRVQDVHEGYGILAEAGREYHYLVVFAHLDNKLAAAGPDLHVNVAGAALYVNWQDDVRLISRGEGGVNKRFVNVQ